MKTHTTDLTIDLAPQAMGADGAVNRCVNLLSTTTSGRRALRCAPALQSIADAPLTPLAVWHHPGDTDLATTLYCGRTAVDMSLWVAVGADELYEVEHPSVKEIYCAVATVDGFTAMTSAGPLTLQFSGDEWICPQAGAPGLMIPELLTASAGSLTSRVSERTFTKVTFTRTGIEVPESQMRALASDLCGAYEDMAAAAANGGLWLQPVAARIILRDTDGNALIESAPVMSRSTVQATALLTALCSKPSAESVEVGAITITADAYRLKLRLSAAVVAGLNAAGVRSVEVWTGPQCHPVDAAAEMPVRWTAVSTQQPALSVAIPGATSHFASNQGAYARRFKAILSNPSGVLTPRLRLSAPFAEGDYIVEAPPFEGVGADNRAAAKAETLAAEAGLTTGAATLLRSLQAPASFIARCGCVCGDRVLWGNLTPLPPATADLINICTFDTSLSGAWTAEVRVAMRGGAELAYILSGSGSPPVGWAPLVAWPSADALSVDVYMKRGSAMLHGHIDLDPAADGASALHLDPDFQSQPWPAFSGSIPAPKPCLTGSDHSGAVAVAPLSAPSVPVKAALCCAAPIVAIAPARRTLSAWDSASARAYAFSSAGIFAINTGRADTTALSSALIDRRPVTSGASVTVTPDGVMAASGSRLLLLSGTTVRERLIGFTIRAVAWSYADSLAWILDRRGNIALYDPQQDTVAALSLPIAPKSMANIATELLVTSAEGVWLPAASPDARPVAWRRIVHIPCGRRIRAVCIHASASHFDGTVTLR
ncbi:MAG: hypothetical protein K2J17_00965, partial [Paramuribaculum sp.]|nr:hypothetical protein [Paramuribaculum sp.]